MRGTFSIFKLKFCNLFFLILTLLFPFIANGGECIYARDTGTIFQVIIPAKPDLTIDNGYNNTTITSQRAAWTDSKLYTNGDPFYFEIEGMWSPWSATFDLIGGDSENSGLYAGLQEKQDNAFYCGIITKNKDVEKFDVNGEFDYISSIKNVSGNSYPYTETMKPKYAQNTCWLTTGEGLYIAFFGATGDTLPSLATHLKTADILCDSKYLLDKNNDGVITVNECLRSNRCYNGDTCTNNEKYDNTNMSYYTIGAVRCESEFYHETEGLPDDAIGINDCYQDVTYSSGIVREDRTLFIFSANYLYKNAQQEKVRKNERIKFVIYDRYYSDNVGQYIINMYGGVTDNSDKGLIEKIVGDLENLFIGSRNDGGTLTGGFLTTLYNYLIVDSNFNFIIRVALIFYMTFLGFSFALGSLEYKTKELLNILLKLTFAAAFTTTTSWELYDRYIIKFFYDGFASVISMLGNISLLVSDDTATVSTGVSMASKFSFIDNIILSLFSDSITKKILGLFFGVWYGFIVIPIIYILIVYYIYQLINALFPYIVMFIQAVLGLFVGPIFIVFSLFKTTDFMFKGWLNFVGGRFANMMFLFLGIFVFWTIIQDQFNSLLYFNSCKIPLLQAITDTNGTTGSAMSFFSFGISVWTANWDNLTPAQDAPTFFNFCLSLLFLYVLIYLFGITMKKIPTIVDGIFAINDERAGGGLDRSGESRLGARIGTFFSNVNNAIKITDMQRDRNGNYRSVKRGIVDYVGIKSREYISKGVTNTAKSAWQNTAKKGYNATKSYLNGSAIKSNVKDEGLRGKEAITAATKRYEEQLKARNKIDHVYSTQEIQDKVDKFRDDMTHYFLRDAKKDVEAKFKEISSAYDKIAKKMSDRTGQKPNDSEKAKILKEQMDAYVRDKFDRQFDGKTGYYSVAMQLAFASRSDEPASSAGELSRIRRELSLSEKSTKYGQNFASFEEYQKYLDKRIGELKAANNSTWKALAQEKYWTAIEEAGRLQTELSEKARAIKESSERIQKELEEKKQIIQKKLEAEKIKADSLRLEVEKLRKAGESSKKEEEILKLTEERVKQLENKLRLQEETDKKERIEKALEDERNKVATIKKEIEELKAKNVDTKTEEELLKLGEEKIKLLEAKLELQKTVAEQKKIEEDKLKLQKEEDEQRKQEEAIRKELEVERTKANSLKESIDKMKEEGASEIDIRKKEEELSKLKAETAPLEEKLQKETEKRKEIEEKKSTLEEKTKQLEEHSASTETRKVKKEIEKEIDKGVQIRKEIQVLKDNPTVSPSKILAKEDELRSTENKVKKLNGQLVELLKQETTKMEINIGKAESRVKALEEKIKEMKTELAKHPNVDLEIAIHKEENKLKSLEEYTTDLKSELSEKSHEILLRNSINMEQELGSTVSSAEKTERDVEQYKQVSKDENFALQGINSETFGVQGVTTLGLGEDNKDPLGFGKGAGAAVMTDSFNTQDIDITKTEEEAYKRLYEENRLKMEKQEAKVLKYKAEMKDVGEKDKAELQQQFEEKQKQIRMRESRLKSSK